MRRKAGQLMSVLVPLAVLGLMALLILSGRHSTAPGNPGHPAAVGKPKPEPPESVFDASASWYNGVALPLLSDLTEWQTTTKEQPSIVQLYIGFTKPLPEGDIRAIIKRGALPVLQVNPRHVSLTEIAQGKYDSQLRADAATLKRINAPVAISFAHEMNGRWFTWGCGSQSSASFIAAWRHIHAILGTKNITYVWTVNHIVKGTCNIMARYPGAQYVNWIGIDGYLRQPSSTFRNTFGPTIRTLTSLGKPILLTEAGVSEGAGEKARLASLYYGARASSAIGIIYFDGATHKGDYEPYASPAFLRAFRYEVKQRAYPGKQPREG